MKDEEGVEYLNKKINKVEKGADWAWWLLIAISVITMIVTLNKML